jgi:hypothetical protein
VVDSKLVQTLACTSKSGKLAVENRRISCDCPVVSKAQLSGVRKVSALILENARDISNGHPCPPQNSLSRLLSSIANVGNTMFRELPDNVNVATM